jgi:hypothetical protein
MPELTRKRVNDRPLTWHVTMLVCGSGRLSNDRVPRHRQIDGNGIAAFIPAAIPVNTDPAPLLRSM